MQELTQEYLHSILNYDAKTGIFTRKVKTANCVKIGEVAGSINSNGYILIRLLSKKYSAHRLAWLYIYGLIPKEIDHINCIKNDNRIDNLRPATRGENLQNKLKALSNNKSSNMLGVSFNKNLNKFCARIQVNRKLIHIGYFYTAQEAHEAYLKAKREHHPFGEL